MLVLSLSLFIISVTIGSMIGTIRIIEIRGEMGIPVSVEENIPPEKKTLGSTSLRNTESGVESSFCRWIAWLRVHPERSCSFTDTGSMVYDLRVQ